MFNNLIESSSHTREFKRRGSFFLFTSATYFMLFVIAGVASIYAYDARLDDLNEESVTMLSPGDFPEAPVAVKHTTPHPKSTTDRPTEVVRQVAMASVNVPQIVPDVISAKPNASLPVPDHGKFKIGLEDSGPAAPGGPGPSGNGSGNDKHGEAPVHVEIDTTPPPQPPVVKRIPPVISKGVITGLAIVLPKPAYPEIAKRAGAHGAVNVQVLIDETGKVISAKAISGSPLLMVAAQQAAFAARFSPTKLSDQPVKVSGVITYNFQLH